MVLYKFSVSDFKKQFQFSRESIKTCVRKSYRMEMNTKEREVLYAPQITCGGCECDVINIRIPFDLFWQQ